LAVAGKTYAVSRGSHPGPVAAADRAICSTLLAQAFEEVGYPILPRPTLAAHAPARVYTPRDFDLSPFFTVVPIAAPQAARPQPAAALAALPPAQPAPLVLRAPAPTLHV
jgi:hypothetical protein